jgi:excinuclease ABC subunit C
MAQAIMNARESLGRRVAESASQIRLLEGVAEAFDLDHPPQRIEVYDNSHIQGTNAIGAFIVAGPDGFVKNQYRKFNIKNADLTPGDDYGMMREVLTRRFTRLVKENTAKPVAPVFDEKGGDEDVEKVRQGYPDLVLIDGGLGQLSVAREVLAELQVTDVPLVGIAKGPDRDAGREHFFMDGRPSFMLEPKSPVLFYLQRLRDEAHRFAIGTHRAKRAKSITASPLDEIDGIGPNRKRALLNHFGSGRAVTRAGLADLEAVGGISKAMARKIYDHFHDKG